MNLNTFKIQPLIAEVVNLFELQIKAKKIKVTINTEPEIEEISSDRDRLKQIFVNLISNAVKFTQYGKIEIMAEKKVIEQKEYIKFIITDSGIGMKKHEQFK